MNYHIEIHEPDGKVVYVATSDLTPLGFAALCKAINEIDLGHGKVVEPQFRDWAWERKKF